MEIDRLSEPSVSARVLAMLSEIAVSSLPLASATVRLGASATATTATFRVAVVVAVAPPLLSVEVASTVSAKSASLLVGGVRVNPTSCAGVSSHLPPP